MLDTAHLLYRDGAWQEALDMLTGFPSRPFIPRWAAAEMDAIEGWCWYHLGMNGAFLAKRRRLQRSRRAFAQALTGPSDRVRRTWALNGISLVLWQLGERLEAWQINDYAVQEFEDAPTLMCTRAILFRWNKETDTSARFSELACEKAIAAGDYLTAGRAKSNMAALIDSLGRREEAEKSYREAIGLYEKSYHATGESAVFYIEAAEQEIACLRLPRLLRGLSTLRRRVIRTRAKSPLPQGEG
jgi:tetratricopeptide (TPR) repeat protein